MPLTGPFCVSFTFSPFDSMFLSLSLTKRIFWSCPQTGGPVTTWSVPVGYIDHL